MPTVETLYIQLHDEIRAREALEVRVGSVEFFIREKFPGDFAGEVGTVSDPELNPVILNTGEPLSEEAHAAILQEVAHEQPRQ